MFCKLVPLLSKSGRNLSLRLSDFSEAQGHTPAFNSPKHARLPPECRHICFDFVEIIRRMCENGMVPEVIQILRLSSADFKDTSDPSRSDSEIVDFINALAEIAWRFRESGHEPREDLLPAFKEFVVAAIRVLRNTPDVRTPLSDIYHSERNNHIVETLEPLRNEHIRHLFTAREMAVLIECGNPPAAQALAGIEKGDPERAATKRKRTAEEAGFEESSTKVR